MSESTYIDLSTLYGRLDALAVQANLGGVGATGLAALAGETQAILQALAWLPTTLKNDQAPWLGCRTGDQISLLGETLTVTACLGGTGSGMIQLLGEEQFYSFDYSPPALSNGDTPVLRSSACDLSGVTSRFSHGADGTVNDDKAWRDQAEAEVRRVWEPPTEAADGVEPPASGLPPLNQDATETSGVAGALSGALGTLLGGLGAGVLVGRDPAGPPEREKTTNPAQTPQTQIPQNQAPQTQTPQTQTTQNQAPQTQIPQTQTPQNQAPEWFYALDGKAVGPVARAEIEARLARGDLQPASLVWWRGGKDWLSAEAAGLCGAKAGPVGSNASPAGAEPPQATRFCTQCGTRLSADDRFCMNCGARLDAE